MAYLLFCLFVPVVGVAFYLVFGINYWRKKLYDKKMALDEKILTGLKKDISQYTEVSLGDCDINNPDSTELAAMLIKDLKSPLTRKNRVKLLVNGEEKFNELIQVLQQARHHIHLEYYIYEQDEIGTAIIELLIKKARRESRFVLSMMILAALQSKRK
jgi:cardiolipin synthase